MSFKDFLNIGTVDESAQLKLELISKINTLIGTVEIGTLRRVAKLLEGSADKNIDEEEDPRLKALHLAYNKAADRRDNEKDKSGPAHRQAKAAYDALQRYNKSSANKLA